MNIFYIDTDPYRAAEQMVDSHVVKMILESAQLLSTAHRIIDGIEYIGKSKSGRKVKRWRLSDTRDIILYSATHVNHPSAVWCRESNNNYNWLYCHFLGLLAEYTYRYGKAHKCESMIRFLSVPPDNIPIKHFTHPTPAMPEEYICQTSLESYRTYYRLAKVHLHKWKNRQRPEWMNP